MKICLSGCKFIFIDWKILLHLGYHSIWTCCVTTVWIYKGLYQNVACSYILWTISTYPVALLCPMCPLWFASSSSRSNAISASCRSVCLHRCHRCHRCHRLGAGRRSYAAIKSHFVSKFGCYVIVYDGRLCLVSLSLGHSRLSRERRLWHRIKTCSRSSLLYFWNTAVRFVKDI